MKVHIRFGVELQTGVTAATWKPMPADGRSAACRWSRTTRRATSTCCIGMATIDPLVVFDANGNYLRSWGKGVDRRSARHPRRS